MAFDSTGYTPKTYAEIVEYLEAAYRESFGNGINLQPTSIFGQKIAITARMCALVYEDLAGLFAGFSPQTASGTALDFVFSLLNGKRLAATKSEGVVKAYGTLGSAIPAGTILSVDGDGDARFVTTENAVIAAGTNEVQTITFDLEPDAGEWTLVYDGVETGTLNYNDSNATIESYLEALSNLDSVSVSGDYSTGIIVEYTGTDGEKPQQLLKIGVNTLTSSSSEVVVDFEVTTAGVLPNVDIPVEAEEAGAIKAYAGTLTVIETPVAGLQSVINDADIIIGKEIETDAELRIRRLESLSTGSGTVDSIRAALLAIDEVTAAKVFENDTDLTDAYDRPPHSIECVVENGDDQDIIDAIGGKKCAGIQTYGEESGEFTDSQNVTHTYYFSRPTDVPIYVEAILTTNSDFPEGGEATAQLALAEYGNLTFSIGENIAWYKLFNAFDDIAGIEDIELFIGTSPSPALQNNITIEPREKGSFDTANISVTVA